MFKNILVVLLVLCVCSFGVSSARPQLLPGTGSFGGAVPSVISGAVGGAMGGAVRGATGALTGGLLQPPSALPKLDGVLPV